MKLIGNYISPYVRRVAVSLNALEIPFELEEVMVFDNPEAVRAHNPVVRIPALVLEDGEVLIESAAILDELDHLVGPERALTPAAGRIRRDVMKITAVAIGSTEKAQWSVYERRFRPEEKVHEPWIEHNDNQVVSGFQFLDRLAGLAGEGGWIASTPVMTQADITSAVAYSFAALTRPALNLAERVPNLAAFAAHCEEMDIFKAAPVPKPNF